MKERTQRLETVRHIIRNHHVRSQEELLQHLQLSGFSVTQATLSRDLKHLKVGKMAEGQDGYYYTLHADEERGASRLAYIQDIERGFLSIAYSGNIGIMKTLPAHADTVAIGLDNLDIDEVLGTIAGDDTIMIVLKEGVSGEDFSSRLRSLSSRLEA